MIQTAGLGHYYRDSKGVWRYSISGEAVPGARDREVWRRSDSYSRTEVDGVLYVRLPASELSWQPELVQYSGHPGTLIEGALGPSGSVVDWYYIPASLLGEGPAPEGGMWAPELEPAKLAHVHDIGPFMGWKGGIRTVRPKMSRGVIPRPCVRLCQTGRPQHLPRTYWTWPLLEQWKHRYESRFGRLIYDLDR